ncbi:uncharacterized protein LOC107608434 [Arachis ipaensis]|uniref:Uncharacterized protein n=1 Tax=Arachis hypogaea TaxID=3818 RepID=A0A445C9I6_ARAHY|nr:uncharacterized protein LOC107608434 [Arachis ipaensis]XP_025668880.1 uncharacterized protein LOC112767208 [Arachis hypogaea]RYR47590.1 hypothetical protein Ahy_A07g033527 [Arachis hypogaea]
MLSFYKRQTQKVDGNIIKNPLICKVCSLAMMSLEKALGPESPRTRTELHADFESTSKKRKWQQGPQDHPPFAQEFFKDHMINSTKKEVFDIQLHLDTPFTPDKWRQFLALHHHQSMAKPEPIPPNHQNHQNHMSLDLDLNLTCESLKKKEAAVVAEGTNSNKLIIKKNNNEEEGLIRTPSWLSMSEGDNEKEMVATVCMRCHMLVMLCKSSPSCPNCKFMHPPDQNPSFLKKRCGPLFC